MKKSKAVYGENYHPVEVYLIYPLAEIPSIPSRNTYIDTPIAFPPGTTGEQIFRAMGCVMITPPLKSWLDAIDETVGTRKIADIKTFLSLKGNIQNPDDFTWETLVDTLKYLSNQDHGAGEVTPGKAKKSAYSKEALALAILKDHPGWTDTQIAHEVGVGRTTLYRWENFKMAREYMRGGRGDMPRGEKDGETGDIDAWDED